MFLIENFGENLEDYRMVHRKETTLGEKQFILETGKLAKLASGSATIQLGETIVFAAVVATDKPVNQLDFMPLQVEYRERTYAAGKIPGGFFKREGRPTEKETVSARLTDRPIRPLFPKDYRNEVQVIIFVLSADKENDADTLGTIAASTALCLSDIPFLGPIGAVRIGRLDGQFIVNPTFKQLESSDMDIVIAGTGESILMVEGWSSEVTEEDMVIALETGLKEIKNIVEIQNDKVKEAGKTKSEYTKVFAPEEMEKKIREEYSEQISSTLEIKEKSERGKSLKLINEKITETLEESFEDNINFVSKIVGDILKEKMRDKILNTSKRIDSRNLDDIRDIECEIGLLPRTHGSALFTRGQTQSLSVLTLGTKIDEQRVEGLAEETWKRFMLHYNFPHFCVGEVRPIRGVGRREIGHGLLAERALKAVIPLFDDFPYTIRIVSDIMESNGSSSMASVCAGSLSLMEAGVPIHANVAGIAMGLIKEGDQVAILTDILGDEDHMGDMDFKVAGTKKGITAFQMDIKIHGITFDIIRDALQKAKTARFHILDIMDKTLSQPKSEMSPYAPRIMTIQIPVESIGLVIGPGGKNIREIIEKTGANIDIADTGIVTIASIEESGSNQARSIIEAMTELPEAGKTYLGKVKKITNFGAFVEIIPGKEGLLHISQIANERIEKVEDVLKVGQEIEVKLLSIENGGKYKLSRKVLLKKSD